MFCQLARGLQGSGRSAGVNQPMTHDAQKKKGRIFDWIFRVEMFALILVMAYYVVTEHRAHLIEYADYLLFGIFILLFALILWHYRQNTTNTTKERKL